MPRLIAVLALSVVLAACERPPQPPDKDAPPEPQVTAATPHARMEQASREQLQAAGPAQRRHATAEVAGG